VVPPRGAPAAHYGIDTISPGSSNIHNLRVFRWINGYPDLPANDTVYVIDPDPAISEAVSTLLGTYDLPVQGFPDAETFLDYRAAQPLGHGCLLIEVKLPGLNGLALLRQLRGEGLGLPTIVLTNAHEPAMHRQAVQFGADRVVEKPLINDVLVYTIMNLLPEVRYAARRNGTV